MGTPCRWLIICIWCKIRFTEQKKQISYKSIFTNIVLITFNLSYLYTFLYILSYDYYKIIHGAIDSIHLFLCAQKYKQVFFSALKYLFILLTFTIDNVIKFFLVFYTMLFLLWKLSRFWDKFSSIALVQCNIWHEMCLLLTQC